ncbi:MAG TPA: vWA domain-containing protein [Polyangiaceae bacterium]|nr:vWA domain-containing protein [Polyangiaceae bacterium]
MFKPPCFLFAATALLSCSARTSGESGAPSRHGGSEPVSASPDSGLVSGSGGSTNGDVPLLFVDSGAVPTRTDDAGTACTRTASAETELAKVHLAIAFDISGSMGKLDKPYYDPTLKWDPVVTAMKAFFTDPASSNLFASLVFFPIDSGESKRCSSDSYTKPDVPMTALPSGVFGDAIDAVTPKTMSDWRGGTPTLAVVQGTYAFVAPLAKADTGSKYALLLVTDGYPEGCSSDDDKIDTVVAAVKGFANELPTYVIGISNPPGGPDTVTNLNDIAAAGGTDRAFIIQTGDPTATVKAFQDAVSSIQMSQLSCDFEIPPPPAGQSFDPTRANVTYASGDTERALDYDASCKSDSAWRFDDETAPKRMILCDATCAQVRADPGAVLRVDFGCARRDVIR